VPAVVTVVGVTVCGELVKVFLICGLEMNSCLRAVLLWNWCVSL